jgi:hypothetical protein
MPGLDTDVLSKILIKADNSNKSFLAIVRASCGKHSVWSRHFDGIAYLYFPKMLFITQSCCRKWYTRRERKDNPVKLEFK